MTGGNLGILYWLIKADSKEFDSTIKGTKEKASKANEDVGMSFIKLGAIVQGATQIYQQVAAVVSDLVGHYAIQEKAEKKLEAVIKATGGAAGFTAAEMKVMATNMQKATTFGDELFLEAQSILATFKSISGDVFPRTIEAAADLATVFDQSLQQSTIMLGKALEDPITGMGALRRVGVTLSEQTQQLVKDFVALGKVEEAQNEILKAVEGQVHGAAKAMAETGTGSLKQLSNAFGDLKEILGELIINGTGPLIDGLKVVTESTTKFIKGLQKSEKESIWFYQVQLDMLGKILDYRADFKKLGLTVKEVNGKLTVLTKTQQELNKEIKTGTDNIKDYTAAQIEHLKQYDKYRKKSAKEVEQEKKAKEDIAKINKKYSDMYFELTHNEIEIIKKKMNEEIKAAKETGASVTLIKKAYNEQIAQIEAKRREESEQKEKELLNKQQENHKKFLDFRREGEMMYSEHLRKEAEKREEMAEIAAENEKIRQEELREEYQKTAENILITMTDVIGIMIQAGMEGEDIWKAFAMAAKNAIASAAKALGKQWIVEAAAAWAKALWPPNPLMVSKAIGLTGAATAAFAAAAIIPSLDTGGMIQQDTIIQAHKNEVILPLDKGLDKLADKLQNKGIGGNIYITVNAGNINSELDMKRIMQNAGKQLRDNMRRM